MLIYSIDVIDVIRIHILSKRKKNWQLFILCPAFQSSQSSVSTGAWRDDWKISGGNGANDIFLTHSIDVGSIKNIYMDIMWIWIHTGWICMNISLAPDSIHHPNHLSKAAFRHIFSAVSWDRFFWEDTNWPCFYCHLVIHSCTRRTMFRTYLTEVLSEKNGPPRRKTATHQTAASIR